MRLRCNSDGQPGKAFIEFKDQVTGNDQTIIANISTYTQNLINIWPNWSGDIANVNERIVAAGIVLTTGDFPCNQYGAYHVKTGSNTNSFDMTNFLNNAVDGQFVTIMAEDTPIKCEPSGNILGTATINSKGLFKIMKYQGNLYSSHL